MKLDTVPFVPLPPKAVKKLAQGFYPLASLFSRMMPELDAELEEAGSSMGAREYIACALLSFTFYLVFLLIFFTIIVTVKFGADLDMRTRIIALAVSFAFSSAIFGYTLLVPRWLFKKRMRSIDKDLLFATRHLMIQTSAGVPLFDAIVSVSENFDDDTLGSASPEGDYGEVGREFSKIILKVRAGAELTTALEESAAQSPSESYRKVMWQLSNANKTGAQMGHVLRETVDYMASEQLIAIRSYGSQLSTLSLFYMVGCIIAPTMGLVILAISASILPNLPVNEYTFGLILLLLVAAQVFFVGLIKSRRPLVSL